MTIGLTPVGTGDWTSNGAQAAGERLMAASLMLYEGRTHHLSVQEAEPKQTFLSLLKAPVQGSTKAQEQPP